MPSQPRRKLWVVMTIVVMVAALALVVGRGLRGHSPSGPAPSAGPSVAWRPDNTRATTLLVGDAAPIAIHDARSQADEKFAHGVLRGLVLDVDSRAPIAGAQLTFVGAGRAYDALSGPDGAFVFNAPNPGRYDLVDLAADGYESFTTDLSQTPLTFQARPRSRVDGVVLTLRAAGDDEGPAAPSGPTRPTLRIEGVVVDETGAGIGDARVMAMLAERHGALGALAISGADGAFRVEVVAEAKAFMVQATKQDFVSAAQKDVAPGTTGLRLVLRRGASLVGEVHSADGPVVAFTITVDGPGPTIRRSVFDPEGRFSIGGLRPATYTLRAYAFGWAPSSPREVVVAETGEAHVALELERGGRVFGRVAAAAAGEPVVGARVSSEGRWAGEGSPLPTVAEVRTDGAGRYEIDGLAVGLRSITVNAEGFHPQIVSGLEIEAEQSLGPIDVALSAVAPGEKPRLELVGIGANVEKVEGAIVLRRLFPGGAAHDYGLLPGDRILRIDGTATASLTMEEAIERLRGTEGSRLVLTVERNGSQQDVTLTRKRVRG